MSEANEQEHERRDVNAGAEQPPDAGRPYRDPGAPPPVSVYDRPQGLARFSTAQIALFVILAIAALFIAYQLIF